MNDEQGAKSSEDLVLSMPKDPLAYKQTVTVLTTPFKFWSYTTSGITLVVLLWSFLGRVPQSISATGVLTIPYKVVTVNQPQAGIFESIKIKPGVVVSKGDVVATLNNISDQEAVDEAKDKYKSSISKYQRTYQTELSNQVLSSQRQIADDLESISNIASSIYDQGVISKQQLENARQNYLSALQTLNSTLSTQEAAKYDVVQAKINLDSALTKLKNDSQFRSQYSGEVLTVYPQIGSLADSSVPFFSLLKNDKSNKQTLSVVTFLTAEESAQVSKGMSVRILPNNILPNTLGYLEGIVEFVSSVAATSEGASYIVGDSALSDQLTQNSRNIYTLITLSKDETSHDGYRWVNGSGPSKGDKQSEPRIGLGASVQITNKTVPPITIAIPATKRLFGIE